MYATISHGAYSKCSTRWNTPTSTFEVELASYFRYYGRKLLLTGAYTEADFSSANSNVNNISFWVLARLVFDWQLRETAKREVDAAWASGNLDIKHLCTQAPVLDRLFCECLRTSAGAMMGRKVTRATHIGGKLLRPGGMVLIPTRQLHSNANVWGADHEEFDESRFAENPSLRRHSSYRPFGGGVSLCPGRQIAKEQVLMFVAILLHDFDIRLNEDTGQKFPALNGKAASLGVIGPAKGMEILVDVSIRVTSV